MIYLYWRWFESGVDDKWSLSTDAHIMSLCASPLPSVRPTRFISNLNNASFTAFNYVPVQTAWWQNVESEGRGQALRSLQLHPDINLVSSLSSAEHQQITSTPTISPCSQTFLHVFIKYLRGWRCCAENRHVTHAWILLFSLQTLVCVKLSS